MSDIETLSPTERSDFNGLVSHADNIGGSIVDPATLDSYKKIKPSTTLTSGHIPVAISEVDSLKNGNPIPGIPPPAAAFIKSGMSDAYRFNPYNLSYPTSATHGTNLEGHVAGHPTTADPNKVLLQDQRTISGATGAKIERGQTTGTYNTDTIKNIIKASRHVGIDPNLAIAVGLQESHLGNKSPDNLGNISSGGYSKIPEGLDPQAYAMAQMLKDKMDEGKKLGYKDEAHLIQMYNGMGKLKPNMSVGGVLQPMKYYGIEVTKDKFLDLKKNPLYGKTIQDLRDNVVKKNPRIQKMLAENN